MKINHIHTDLKELYKDKQEGLESKLGFIIGNDQDFRGAINLFKKGYWNLVPFVFDDEFDTFSIKITPKKGLKNSPIVSIDNNDTFTLAPNFKSFLPFFRLQFFFGLFSNNRVVGHSFFLLKSVSGRII